MFGRQRVSYAFVGPVAPASQIDHKSLMHQPHQPKIVGVGTVVWMLQFQLHAHRPSWHQSGGPQKARQTQELATAR